LFILTTVDAGTRATRFMIQDIVGSVAPRMRDTRSWAGNLVASAVAVAAWGALLYEGVSNPLGGVNSLWPLFGISNQMLAAIALTLGTVVLARGPRPVHALLTALPAAWLCLCSLAAGGEKLFSSDPRVGFLAHAQDVAHAAATGTLPRAIADAAAARRIIANDYLDAALCAILMTIVVVIAAGGLLQALDRRALQSRSGAAPPRPSPLA
jgi:carbon starvation protein